MKLKFLHISLILLCSGQLALAQTPVIQTSFTADPAPMVYKDTVFLYTGHDDDRAIGFKMKDWLLYTSTDMVNWTDHGAVASVKDFKWANSTDGAWAAQCIARNGKFYLYCSMPNAAGIGVMVADSPYGPFKDPIGKALIKNSMEDIDPSVLIDDDGQAYLYWGNPNLWYVKLNEDMISTSGDLVKDPSFAKVKGSDDIFHYQEGPWAWKRNGKYYMAYASTCCPEGIGYATGETATGPWKYGGMIMDGDARSSGNHPGIIDYKGKSYVFGFDQTLRLKTMSQHYERRSVRVKELKYTSDGKIEKLPFWTPEELKSVGSINPYQNVKAVTMAYSEGVKTDVAATLGHLKSATNGGKIPSGMVLTSIHNGDYIKVRNVNFSKGASAVEVLIAALYGGQIEVHSDAIEGPLLGVVNMTNKGEGDVWRTIKTPVKTLTGLHDLYFVFKGKHDLFYFDSWQFSGKR
ncbi:family 43 glycosylhydrolase [Pedobacter terrae]|uniref:family 43 glycosylhydrolase n=1 Tax=Pedobacter terrae TaxID=405671 RepID=UPI002FF644C9